MTVIQLNPNKKNDPNPEVIELLERVLELARGGEVLGVTIIYELRDLIDSCLTTKDPLSVWGYVDLVLKESLRETVEELSDGS